MPPEQLPIFSVARVIQLSVAPVFLLTALGTMLGVFSTRLGRIVDRARVLTDRLPALGAEQREAVQAEFELLLRRRSIVNVAIACATAAALLVCILIASAFLSAVFRWDFTHPVAALFVAAMGAFIAALLAFLAEVTLAVRSVRFGDR
ncbi:MAG TPA: DUF2721 domain-containing protein [Anaeromyxobacter sp.]|nr:DUF2721 domain-containing protein [Anaeromyxobacter sp.]